MNYGQTPQSPVLGPEQDFFTPGVGDASEDINPDLAHSLNTNAYRDPRGLGDAAIFLAEQIRGTEALPSTPQPASEALSNLTENHQNGINAAKADLGQVVNLEVETVPKTAESPAAAFNRDNIITRGDKLSKASYKEAQAIEAALGKTGDVASFYEAIRGEDDGMVKANLNNSYKENSAWKEEEKS